MSKFLTFLGLAFLIPFTFTFANTVEENWVYVFHLQYKQGVLGVKEGIKYVYDSVPDLYTAQENSNQTDFYGIITSGRGKELARFGFNTPTTTVLALGKSVFNVRAPSYANADNATFYKKGGKKLFSISLKGSSFCNDDNKCNANVGENSQNCPNDCHTPQESTEFTPPPLPITVVSTPKPVIEAKVTMTNIPTTTTTPPTTPQNQNNSTQRIVWIVTGTLALVLAGILWYIRRNMD